MIVPLRWFLFDDLIDVKILGIDPGLATVGYACLECNGQQTRTVVDFGCILTSESLPFNDRIAEIADDYESILERFSPDVVIIEELYFSKNVKTAIAVAQVRGVIKYLSHKHNIESCDINPMQIKLSITGDGKADKKQVQKMLMHTLKLSTLPTPDDAADALAAALSYSFVPSQIRANML